MRENYLTAPPQLVMYPNWSTGHNDDNNYWCAAAAAAAAAAANFNNSSATTITSTGVDSAGSDTVNSLYHRHNNNGIAAAAKTVGGYGSINPYHHDSNSALSAVPSSSNSGVTHSSGLYYPPANYHVKFGTSAGASSFDWLTGYASDPTGPFSHHHHLHHHSATYPGVGHIGVGPIPGQSVPGVLPKHDPSPLYPWMKYSGTGTLQFLLYFEF